MWVIFCNLQVALIFGALAKDDDITKIIILCKENGFEHVKFSQAELSVGGFSLKYREIIAENWLLYHNKTQEPI